ncbi:tetratricopeptide repeat protein 16 isoform X1 [Eptesicus fuscus]|uniref:tetratricopeptide repeat protein 16 isoform X1 n=1 Tax=Eptesicus fuscus TaxID=29078 RepID=UPI002404359E|nr:tetratricopeptide repeat protein 16 isoform X1 [Eptesicus fuscus]
MADSKEEFPEPKPWVNPLPRETIHRIFGTSQAFRSFDEIRPTLSGLTVPLKVREYYHRGHWCLEREDWETAVLFFSRAIHLDPQLVDFYALRAEAYIQLCDYSSAVQNLRRAHSFQPDNTQFLKRLTLVLYLQGQCLFEQCAFLDALNVFSQAFELQPEKPSFRYRCMACLLALRRYKDCLLLVIKEVKHGTTNADIYILRARLYNFFGKPHLCYQDLHSALVLDPKHPQARVLLKMMVDQAQKSYRDARILAVQGKLQHAVQCVNCAIDNNPLDPSFFLFRGTLYRRLQEFDAAVEDFLKALDMMTEHQEDMVRQAQRQLLLAYNDFAVHCYMQGAYQESVLLLNKVLKDEQQEKGLYINRGDCFFQLGYLNFAEADYQEALTLSPRDEGANLRMGLLQEKMGFCEHRSKQFQKAESHFTMAIQHSPQVAQYYLHRARSRQLIQNIYGARQDVATALLLDPKQPKLLSLITNLFPGMSVEEVLGSQVGLLAKMQLSRVLESRLQNNIPQGIMGQLYKQELERQKARTLQLSWKKEKLLCETSQKLDSTPQTVQEEPRQPEEAVDAEEEEQPEQSRSASYLDQTSSGSMSAFRIRSTSETETSTTCQEYRSTSATPVLTSDSSLLRTQSSDLGNDKEDLSPNDSPINNKAFWSQSQVFSKAEVMRSQSQKPTKTEATQGPRQKPTKTEATQGPRQKPTKAEATQGPRQKPAKAEATQGPRQKPAKAEATQGPRQKPTKAEATQGPRQRLRKTKVVHRRSPIKAEVTQGRTRGLIRSSSKTKTDYDPSWSPNNTEATQGEGQWLVMAKVLQNWNPSTESSKTDVIQDLSQNPSEIQASQKPSPDSVTSL